MAWFARTIGDMEPQVESAQGICEHDDDLNRVIDAIVSGFVMEPAGITRWSLYIRHSSAESSSEREQRRCEQHQYDLGIHAALFAKMLNWTGSWRQHGKYENRNRQECQDSEERHCEELNISKLRTNMHIERVEAIHGGYNDHDEQRHDDAVEDFKS